MKRLQKCYNKAMKNKKPKLDKEKMNNTLNEGNY